MTHPLDNPVWASLNSDHAALARMAGSAGYPTNAAPFIAVRASDAQAAEQSASLVAVDESVCFVGLAPLLSSAWSISRSRSRR